jgi:inosine/xanthosine triphosphate pyrophosphatase family protein
LAQLTLPEKNKISSRSQCLKKFLLWWKREQERTEKT